MPNCINWSFALSKGKSSRSYLWMIGLFLMKHPSTEWKSCHIWLRKLLLPSPHLCDCSEHKGRQLAGYIPRLAWLKHARSGRWWGNSGSLCWLSQRANRKLVSSALYNEKEKSKEDIFSVCYPSVVLPNMSMFTAFEEHRCLHCLLFGNWTFL